MFSAGVHGVLVATLLGASLVHGQRPPEARTVVSIAMLPPTERVEPEPTPEEVTEDLQQLDDWLEPSILSEVKEIPLDESELELLERFDELPLTHVTERMPLQAFRKPKPPAPAQPVADIAAPEPEPLPAEPAPAAEIAPSPVAGSCPNPDYPARAQRRGWEGEVVALVTVAADGEVTQVVI